MKHFDYIVGNPPYNRGLKTSYMHPSLYKTGSQYGTTFFIAKALDLAQVGDTITYVVPANFLTSATKELFRKHLLHNRVEVVDCGSGVDIFNIKTRRIIIITIIVGGTGFSVDGFEYDPATLPLTLMPLFKCQKTYDSYMATYKQRGWVYDDRSFWDLGTGWCMWTENSYDPNWRIEPPGKTFKHKHYNHAFKNTEDDIKSVYDYFTSDNYTAWFDAFTTLANNWHILKYLPKAPE
jgi:hypothetical protein